MNLKHRSYQKELLDSKDIPFKDIARNMRELDFINTHLGGHSITISGLKKILRSVPSSQKEFSICEIGCGGGDNLRILIDWCSKKNIKVRTIGIDINPDCIAYAKSLSTHPQSEWITSDYKLVSFPDRPDIIFNSLFCHHFNDEQMIEILKWMQTQSKIGFFINDLHRHMLAYFSIKMLTALFSKSYLVKNDAPLSVRRGFRKNEIKSYLSAAGNAAYSIEWKWAFRWLIISTNSNTA